MKTPRNRGEEGYALIAAVASILLFSILALVIMNGTRSRIATGSAEVQAARAGRIAEAGVVYALSRLLERNPAHRWTMDDRPRSVQLMGASLSIRIIDERGKVPLNLLEEETAEALLTVAGLSGERLRIARDSLLDWLDDDDERRPDGAERGYYRARNILPRNGPVQSVEELGRIKGFDADVVRRLLPLLSADFGSGGFDPRFAQPEAIAVMAGNGGLTPQAIARAREQAGQRTALEFLDAAALIARPLTISVQARTADGAMAQRRCVVELTGNAERPYVVRHCATGDWSRPPKLPQ